MAKNTITPTNEEKVLGNNDRITSTTDTKGMITDCNQIFMDMAEYNKQELMNVNHNIVRHPDMPQVAFKLAWEAIQSGNEFIGFIKNLRKNGGYYWVFTTISPDCDSSGKTVSYSSVRVKPNKSAIDTMIPLYKKLVELEKSGGMEASGDYLTKFLSEKNTTFTALMRSLQG